MVPKLFIILSLLVSISCARKNEESAQKNQTPNVLNEEKRDVISLDLSKSSRSDIIQKLYDEALKKDNALKKLHNRIGQISSYKEDSLAAYNNYLQNNADYWSEAINEINHLGDSILKKETLKIFKVYEEEYNKLITKHKNADSLIKYKAELLSDQCILLRLFVTERMIKNYQMNELPNISTLHNLNKKYDAVIRETKDIIKITTEREK